MNFEATKLHIHSIALDLENGVELSVLSDDLFGSPMQGNKWRKLLGAIPAFRASNKKGMLSFGGAYSNHAFAISYVAQQLEIPLKLLVRGERAKEISATLQDCEAMGAELIFVSREQYSKYRNADYGELSEHFEDEFVVPEGGDFELGEMGFNDFAEIMQNYTHVALALGTGTTARGILRNMKSEKIMLVYPVLKGLEKAFSDIDQVIWRDTAHMGGYAKVNADLLEFCVDFYTKYKVPLDPVYTGKAMYALMQDIENGYFEKGAKILFYHTGGLQGIRGFNAWVDAYTKIGFDDFVSLK